MGLVSQQNGTEGTERALTPASCVLHAAQWKVVLRPLLSYAN